MYSLILNLVNILYNFKQNHIQNSVLTNDKKNFNNRHKEY